MDCLRIFCKSPLPVAFRATMHLQPRSTAGSTTSGGNAAGRIVSRRQTADA